MKIGLTYCAFYFIPILAFSQKKQFDAGESTTASKVRHILVESVPVGTETVVAISCEDFTRQFSRRLKIIAIVNEDTLNAIASLIKKVSFERRNKGIDVRCRVVYFVDGNIQHEICLGLTSIMVDNRTIKTNKKLRDYLSPIAWNEPN